MGIVFPSGTQTDVPNIVSARVTANSQTAMEFNIPSDVYKIDVIFDSLSTSDSSPMAVQVGTSVAWTTSGYAYSSNFLHSSTGNTRYTGAFTMRWEDGNAERSGCMTLFNVAGNRWISNHLWGNHNSGSYGMSIGGGVTDLGSSVLTRIRIVAENLTATFDSGWAQVNLYYE